ncbi:TIGR02117 family protein [Kaistella polysaccharea]|uniref:TIGR02117 family protein n=1 Tax=Kaistella polysaccharea TaxID=2878534 RepID=UPI001CF15243|nr:TIGR02117 family protein [Kaistella polysaccharea]
MKKIILVILKTIWAFIGLIAVYVLLVLALPYFETPAQQVSEPKTVETFILTNGVHTDIVVPIKSKQIDWSKEILFSNTTSKSTDFKYLSIGWGDKGFYLDTPEWADLKVSTAINAAFWLGESAMHCTFYKTMTESKDCKRIMLTEKQYADLINFIQKKFDRDEAGNLMLIKTDAVYTANDAFYDAQGSYSFLNTCNTWTNNALKTAGQKAAFWTATDFGIFQHYD